MILPTAIGTVANALVIIDYVIKFAKFLSPRVAAALLDTKEELSRIASRQPVTVAEKALIQALSKHVPASQFEATSLHLSKIFSIMYPLFDTLSTSQKEAVLPDYGPCIYEMLPMFADLLESWGCFQVWGQYFLCKGYYSDIGPFLLARNTTKVLRHTRVFNERIEEILPKANVYFDTRKKENEFVGLIVTNGECKKSDSNHYFHGIQLVFTPGPYPPLFINFPYDVDYNNESMMKVFNNSPPARLFVPEYEMLIIGLFADLAIYSRAVIDQVDVSSLFTERLTTFLADYR